MKKSRILYVLMAFLMLGGCFAEKTPDDGPKPWAAPSTKATTTEPTTEWTKQAEMPTLAALETDSASITLPQGVTAADITVLEQALWMQFFYHELTASPARTQDVLPYLTNGAVPWGLFYLYDAFDPQHTHGEYEQLFVDDAPDPLSQFPDAYYKVDETVLRFLLADVFHVQPDLTVADEGFYFRDGFGYFNCLPTGLEGYETHIRACQTLPEGRLRITAELMIAEDVDSFAHARSAFLEGSIIEKDNLRFWQIDRVEPFE